MRASKKFQFDRVSENDFANVLKIKDYCSDCMNRIYEIKLYLEKINHDAPDSDNLFPRPIFSTKSPAYYSNKQVRGEHWFGDFTKLLSNRLHLSKVYI